MRELGAFRNAGCAAGVHQHPGIPWLNLNRRRLCGCLGQQVLEPVRIGIARDVLKVPFLLLRGKGKQELEQPGEILLNIGDDHVF